jgi:hypothetical protein
VFGGLLFIAPARLERVASPLGHWPLVSAEETIFGELATETTDYTELILLSSVVSRVRWFAIHRGVPDKRIDD